MKTKLKKISTLIANIIACLIIWSIAIIVIYNWTMPNSLMSQHIIMPILTVLFSITVTILLIRTFLYDRKSLLEKLFPSTKSDKIDTTLYIIIFLIVGVMGILSISLY